MLKKTSDRALPIFFRGFFLGLLGLSAFYYFLLFVITKDPVHPFTQFKLFQPWMSLLISGFGVQMGLFWLMKNGVQFSLQEKQDSKMAVGTGTAVSGLAMVACCAHHAVDLLPILGLSAATLLLSEYQKELLIFGVFANLIGVVTMFWFITGKAKSGDIFNFISKKVRSSL